MRMLLPYIVILTLVPGCNYKDSKVGALKGKVFANSAVLNFIGHWHNEGLREKLVYDMVREFEFNNQENPVNMKFPDEIYYNRNEQDKQYEFIRKCITAEKSDWDVLRINNEFEATAAYLKDPEWASKYLIDFSTMPEFTRNVEPELLEITKANCGGIIPGPIIEGYNYALWFNKELASDMGISIKTTGMSADDFKSYIRAVYDFNQKRSDKIIPIFECGNWSTISTLGEQLFISEVDNKTEIMADQVTEAKLQAWYKTLKFTEELGELKILDYDIGSLKWDETTDYPLEKKCLFYLNGTWMYNIWQKIDSKKVRNMMPAEMPSFKQSNSAYIGGYNVTWVIPKNARNKEAAIKFLLFMNSSGIAEKWTNYTKCSSGIKSLLASANFGIDQFEEYNATIDKKYGVSKIAPYGDSFLILGKSRRNINNQFVEVIHRHLNAKDAFDKFKKDLRNFR